MKYVKLTGKCVEKKLISHLNGPCVDFGVITCKKKTSIILWFIFHLKKIKYILSKYMNATCVEMQ